MDFIGITGVTNIIELFLYTSILLFSLFILCFFIVSGKLRSLEYIPYLICFLLIISFLRKIKEKISKSCRKSIIFNLKHNTVYLIQILLISILIIYNISNTYIELVKSSKNSIQDFDTYYIIAKCCGCSLKILIPSIYIPLSRIFYTKILNSKYSKYLELKYSINDHKIFAYISILFSVVHIVTHFMKSGQNHKIYDISQNHKIYDISQNHKIYDISQNHKIYDISQNHKIYDITGILMCICIILAFLSIKLYHIRLHQLFSFIFVIMFLVHTSFYNIILFSPYILNKISERFVHRYSVAILDICIIPNTEFFKLIVTRPRFSEFELLKSSALNSSLGQWVYIRQNRYEKGRKFTITNVTSYSIEFLIKKTGSWTTSLCQKSKDFERAELELIGPFGQNISQNSNKNRHSKKDSIKTIIATGSGISLVLSILNSNSDQIFDIHISEKYMEEFGPVIELLKIPMKHRITLYLTDKFGFTTSNICKIYKNFIIEDCDVVEQSSIHRGVHANDKTGPIIVFNRPNIDSIVKNSESIHVCGSMAICKITKKAAKKYCKSITCESF